MKMNGAALAQVLGMERADGWKDSGIYYGYPECCIDAFVTTICWDTKQKYPEGPWVGTGFIPCLACADKASANFSRFIEEHIVPNRQCPHEFPNDDMGPLPNHTWSK